MARSCIARSRRCLEPRPMEPIRHRAGAPGSGAAPGSPSACGLPLRSWACCSRLRGQAMNHDCSECSLGGSRRQFLREAGAALAALATLGVSVAEAEFRIERTRALRTGPKTLTYPIPAQDGVQIDDKQEVILVRWQGAVYAF